MYESSAVPPPYCFLQEMYAHANSKGESQDEEGSSR